MTRRLASRTVAAVGTLSAIALVASCADAAEVVEVCASHTNPPVRADDRNCEAPANGAGPSQYGWYQIQLPSSYYDWDNDVMVYPSIVVVDVGRPLPPAGTPGAGAFVSGPARATGAGVLRPPAKSSPTPGSTVGGSTISRGGLGVSGTSGSAGS